jgi:hypothetical protein
MQAFLILMLIGGPLWAQDAEQGADPPTVFDIIGTEHNRQIGKAHLSILGKGANHVAKGFSGTVKDMKITWVPVSAKNKRKYRRIFPRRDVASLVDPWKRIQRGKGQQARLRALRKQFEALHRRAGIEVLILGRSEQRTRVLLTDDGDEIPGSIMTDVDFVALMLPSGERLFSRSRRLRWPSVKDYDPSVDLEIIGRGIGRRFRKRLAAYLDGKAGEGEDSP